MAGGGRGGREVADAGGGGSEWRCDRRRGRSGRHAGASHAARAGDRADRLRRAAAAHHLRARRPGAPVQPAEGRRRRHRVLPRGCRGGGGRGGAGAGATLHRYRISDRRAAPFVTGVAEYDVSADGRKLLYRTGGGAGGRGRGAARGGRLQRQPVSGGRGSQPAAGRSGSARRLSPDVSGAPRGVQADLRRRLAQPAGLSLRAERARIELAEDEGDVRRAPAVRQSPRGSQLPARQHGRRDRRRAFVRPRRGHARCAAIAGRSARRRLRRSRWGRRRPLQDHAHLRQRKLESGSARAALGAGRRRLGRRLHRRHQRHGAARAGQHLSACSTAPPTGRRS